MKKTNNGNIVLVVAISIFALISICVLFASAFDDPTWGTGFEVIFGLEDKNTTFCLGLFISLLCGIMTMFLPIFAYFTKGKAKTGLYIFIAILAIIGGTFMLFGKAFFISSNSGFENTGASSIAESLKLGTALITNAVFMYLSALLSGVGIYLSSHNQED